MRDYARLSDIKRTQDLMVQADEHLWPAVPEKIRDLKEWLTRAEGVASGLAGHFEALRAIEAQATKRPAVEAGTGLRLPSDPKQRVGRGGGYMSSARGVRVALRQRLDPGQSGSDWGLRPARSLER